MTKAKFVPTHMRLITNNGVFAYKGTLYEKQDLQGNPIDYECPEHLRAELVDGPKSRFRMVGEDGNTIPNAHDIATEEAKAAERASRTTTSGRVRATTAELLGDKGADAVDADKTEVAADTEWMDEADGVVALDKGGDWFDIVADWLPQAEKVQGADAAKARVEELRAAGDPSDKKGADDKPAGTDTAAAGSASEAAKAEETKAAEAAKPAEEAPKAETADKPKGGVTITTKAKGTDTDGAQQA